MHYRKQSGYFQFDEDPLAKISQGIVNFFHEVIIILKFLQTKRQVKSMNKKYYDSYNTVYKKLNDEEED